MAGFSVNSADRCLAILELLAKERSGLSLTDIAGEIGLVASATHRLLGVLRDRGYVAQDEASGNYVATLRFAALSARVLAGTSIVEVCQPVLDKLAAACSELVRFSILEGRNLIWIAKAQGSRLNIRYDPINGQVVPLHTTAMGKAWLSTLPEEEAVKILMDRGLGGSLAGPKAAMSIEELRVALRQAGELQFGIVEEEAEAGISAISVVVRDELSAKRSVVGCLSVGGPSMRLDRQRLLSFLPALRASAHELGHIWIRDLLPGNAERELEDAAVIPHSKASSSSDFPVSQAASTRPVKRRKSTTAAS